MRRHIEQVDGATGEVLDGVLAWVARRPSPAFGQRWFMASQDALDWLVTHPELSRGEVMRVFFAIVAQLDFENYFRVAQIDVAKKLGMQRTHVCRAFKTLVKHGALLEGPRSGSVRTYRLNPTIAWKGRTTEHKRELERIRKGNVVAFPGISL